MRDSQLVPPPPRPPTSCAGSDRTRRVNYEVQARIAPVERQASSTAKVMKQLQTDWADLQEQLRMNSNKVMALQDSVAKVTDDRGHVEDTVRQVRGRGACCLALRRSSVACPAHTGAPECGVCLSW